MAVHIIQSFFGIIAVGVLIYGLCHDDKLIQFEQNVKVVFGACRKVGIKEILYRANEIKTTRKYLVTFSENKISFLEE